jgi:hypothetical protein
MSVELSSSELSSLTLDAAVAWSQGVSVEVCRVAVELSRAILSSSLSEFLSSFLSSSELSSRGQGVKTR